MLKVNVKSGLAVLLLIFSAACSEPPAPLAEDALVGGAAGTAVGAVVGAEIGHGTGHGSGAGALAGAGIGMASGTLMGIGLHNFTEQATLWGNERTIRLGDASIINSYQRIETAREGLLQDETGVSLNPLKSEYIFTGPTLGTYNRN